MLNKLGSNQSFKGRIEVAREYLNRGETFETVSKALTPNLKKRIEKELPKDWVIEFNTPNDCKLIISDNYNPDRTVLSSPLSSPNKIDFIGFYTNKEKEVPVKEFVRNYVNKILDLHKNLQNREYVKEIHETSLLMISYFNKKIKKS